MFFSLFSLFSFIKKYSKRKRQLLEHIISLVKFLFTYHHGQGFLLVVDLSVSHFGQNGQKLSANYKISILGQNSGGTSQIFYVRGIPPGPPLVENLHQIWLYLVYKYTAAQTTLLQQSKTE